LNLPRKPEIFPPKPHVEKDDLPYGLRLPGRHHYRPYYSRVYNFDALEGENEWLEGGEAMAPTIEFLTRRGVPVIGHVGLTPQAVNVLGGYGARGREQREAAKIIGDAKSVDEAGAFCIVVEGVMESIADEISREVAVPVVGIGASAQCDGQVLVIDDMLGMFERTPRFVKRYDDLASRISEAARTYAEEVRARRFPTSEQTYRPKP
jgi:3-methyl-2-oxobutanoate hydroxymethyltransferase